MKQQFAALSLCFSSLLPLHAQHSVVIADMDSHRPLGGATVLTDRGSASWQTIAAWHSAPSRCAVPPFRARAICNAA